MSTTDAPATKPPAAPVRARTSARTAMAMAARVVDMRRVYAQGFAAVNDCVTCSRIRGCCSMSHGRAGQKKAPHWRNEAGAKRPGASGCLLLAAASTRGCRRAAPRCWCGRSRQMIEALAGDEWREARCPHTQSPQESTMSRSSLMTALALLLATTTASAAKTPARVVVHEGDSLQAAIDAASAGTTIVVEPGIYHGDGAT